MKKLSTLACLFLVAGFISGCGNTLDGAGRDIEKAGEKIQETF
jgi:predicted small secreted protein